jgi:hypothetical protein
MKAFIHPQLRRVLSDPNLCRTYAATLTASSDHRPNQDVASRNIIQMPTSSEQSQQDECEPSDQADGGHNDPKQNRDAA